MICSTCEGSKKNRDNKCGNGTYTFRKTDCHRCNGTGESPMHFSVDELKIESDKEVEIHCENVECDYSLKSGKFAELNFQVSMDGGYLTFVGDEDEGGMSSLCPSCSESSLVINIVL